MTTRLETPGSSNVAYAEYDEITRIMEVGFKSKKVDEPVARYRYEEAEEGGTVLERVFEMMNEEGASVGSLVARFLKKNSLLVTTKLESEATT